MTRLQVIKTTDGKFVGTVFEFPEFPYPGMEIPAGDYVFEIVYVKQHSETRFTFGNFNYQVTAEIIQ